MKTTCLRTCTVLVVAALAAAGCADPTKNSESDAGDLPPEAEAFVELVNVHRQSQGLDSLTLHDALADVATAHSRDMRDRGFFSHTNPDGESPFDRMAEAGISFRSAGENIARGYPTASGVLEAWINSPGHRANIETAGFSHHGIGYVKDGHYWTHLFARDPSEE
jgi:uncharacterized protein YkwD